MSTLDDLTDDLLRDFRADEAVLDPHVRARMWEEVSTTTGATAVPGHRRPPRFRRAVAIAAALVVSAGTGAAVARATTDPGATTVVAGGTGSTTASTQAAVPTLADLADEAAARTGPVLGDAGATYAHVVASSVDHSADGADTAGRSEVWVATDGTGRRVGTRADGVNDADRLYSTPGDIPLGMVRPEAVLALPADGAAAVTATAAALGADGPDGPAVATALVEALAYPGLPASAHAGALRALDELGVTVTSGTHAGTVTFTGPAPDGGTLIAVYDTAAGRVVSRQVTAPDGATTATWYSEADLRPTTD